MTIVALSSLAYATGLAAPVAQNAQGQVATVGEAPAVAVPALSQPLKDAKDHMLLREQRTDLPIARTELPFAVCDLDEDGQPEVVQAVSRGGHAKSLQWLGAGNTPLAEIPALASPVSRVSLIRLRKNGRHEVLINTSDTGAAYVYGLLDGNLKRLSQTPHIWSSLLHAVPVSLDSDPGTELLCIADNGGGNLYKQTTQGWLRLWKGNLTQDVPTAMVSADVNGDGLDEVVCVSPGGTMTMHQYQYGAFKASHSTAMHENVESMTAADLDKDGKAEVVTRNGQGYLSVLKAEHASMRTVTRYDLADAVGPVFTFADMDGDGHQEMLLGGRNRQLLAYRWEGLLLRSIGRIQWTEDIVSATWLPTSGLVLTGASGTLTKVRLVREDYIRVEVGGKEYMPVATPILKDGRLYVSSRDLGDLFGLGVSWDAATKTTVIARKGVSAGFKADSTEYTLGGAKAPDKLESAPVTVNGRLFVPLRTLIRLFGIPAQWKPELRLLAVQGGR